MRSRTTISVVRPASRWLEKQGAERLGVRGWRNLTGEGEAQLRLRAVVKHWITVLAVAFVVFTAGLLYTLKQKPLFRARALVEILRENGEVQTVQQLFRTEIIPETYLETQHQILKSENLARRVITKLGLERRDEFHPSGRVLPPPGHALPGPVQAASVDPSGPLPSPGDVDSEVLNTFQKDLAVERVKQSRLVEISFDSRDPELAAQAVNTLCSEFVDQSIQARWDAAQSASRWLAKELDELKSQLEHSEDELQQYAHSHGLVFVDSGDGTSESIANQRLQVLQRQLLEAQSQRYDKEVLFRMLEADDSTAAPAATDSRVLELLSEELARLKVERSRLTTTLGDEHIRVKEIDRQIEIVAQQLSKEGAQITRRIARQYRAAMEHEAVLEREFQKAKAEAIAAAERSVHYNILKREADTNKQLYVGLLQRLKEAGVSTTLKAPGIRVVDPAYPPVKPRWPPIPFYLTASLFVGLVLGVSAALFQEHLDNSLKSAEETEQWLKLPTLASLPVVGSSKRFRQARELVERTRELTEWKRLDAQPSSELTWKRIEGLGRDSRLAEAIYELRTSILLSTAERPPVSLLLTSTLPGEGKTTVSANLALSLAQLNERVLLVDADLRRARLHHFFGLDNSAGLVNYLTGFQDWRALVSPVQPAGLHVLTSGPAPPNPTDLLTSESMRALVLDASREYRFVVVDSPPLFNLADSRILATMMDGVVLVVGMGIAPRDVVRRAYNSLLDMRVQILGASINFAGRNAAYDAYLRRGKNAGADGKGASSSPRSSGAISEP